MGDIPMALSDIKPGREGDICMTVSLFHIDNLYVWDLEGGVRLASPDMVSDQGPAGKCMTSCPQTGRCR